MIKFDVDIRRYTLLNALVLMVLTGGTTSRYLAACSVRIPADAGVVVHGQYVRKCLHD